MNPPLNVGVGHLYAEWSVRLNITRLELQCLHRHFKVSTPECLTSVLRREDPHMEHPYLLKDLRRIQRYCEVCQTETLLPTRCRDSFPRSREVLDTTVCIDIMELADRSFFHDLDKAKLLGGHAIFLDSQWMTWKCRVMKCRFKPTSAPRTALRQTPGMCSQAKSGIDYFEHTGYARKSLMWNHISC